MKSPSSVWVFSGEAGRFPGGIFSSIELAEAWIATNKLSGTLTAYPVDKGVLDWALQHNLVNMRPEKLAQKRHDPSFIGSFTTASQEHFHYTDGKR